MYLSAMENDDQKASTSNTQPITVLGKRLLEEELKQILSVERPANIEAIETARLLGDLRENAEYHAAKEKQSFIAGRLDHIKGTLASATVIDPSTLKLEHIAFGATVSLVDTEKDEEVVYQIVGVDEADVAKGKISFSSPLARALVGKKEGDEVVVRTPKGSVNYEIVAIEYR